MLQKRGFRDFSKTETEKKTFRILNLFYLAKSNGTNIVFWYCGIYYQIRVVDVEMGHIVLLIPGFEIKSEQIADIYFEILNQYYHGIVNILEYKNDHVTIKPPEELRFYRDRTYQRIKFDDLFMRFNIEYASLFTTKGREIELQSRYPFFFAEVMQDCPSIKFIYNMLLSKIREIGDNFSVEMLYLRDPKTFTLFEQALLKEKSTVLIEDVSKIESYTEPLDMEHITNLSSHYQKRVGEIGQDNALSEIEKLRKEDSRNFLVSYLMTPIHIYDRVIGYIRINTDQFQKHWLHRLIAQEFHTICQIFSYGLTKTRVWHSHFNPSSVHTRILDLSADGLLIEIFDKTLFEYLRKFKEIKVVLPIADHELTLFGEIIRYIPRGGRYYMGVHIYKSYPGNEKILEEYLSENLVHNFF